jgi:hypothetical protein
MHLADFWKPMALACALATLPAIAADQTTPPPAPAPANEAEAQRAEITQLRERIATLERQCPDLSGQQPPAAGGVAGGTEKYLLKARWDRLKTGMERDEVKVLLGHPSTITRSAAGQVEVWGYGSSRINRYGVGTVYFDDDEEVTTWISPTFKTN